MIDLRQLRYFIAVAEALNVRRAAKKLGMQQPTLSRHVAEIEETIGVWLFERHRGGMRLTSAGERFLRDARRVLFEFDRAVACASASGRAEAGRLGIGVFVSLADGPQRNLLARFQSEVPRVDIDLVEGSRSDHLARLRDRRLDIAFTFGEVDRPWVRHDCRMVRGALRRDPGEPSACNCSDNRLGNHPIRAIDRTDLGAWR
jgi:DNA-binding transcriptional LysR family regulator